MFKVIFVIIGTLIGAGFASGREIYIFFTKYGFLGIIGIFLSGLITTIIIYKVFTISKKYEISSYKNLLKIINTKYPKINIFINSVVNIFLLLCFYIMVAGFSSYIKQTYNVPIYLSSSIFVSVCYLVFKKNVSGVIKTNEILVPILIFLIIVLGIKNIPFISNINKDEWKNILTCSYSNNVSSNFKIMWLIASLLYVSHNSIILIPVLVDIKNCVKTKKEIIKISFISGIAIIVLALIVYSFLLKQNYFIDQLEMPLAEVVSDFGNIYKYAYGFLIISSIFTSCIAAGYSFLENVAKNNKRYNFYLIMMCIMAIFISNIGFSNLVEILYPLFGLLGLIQLIFLIF